VSHVEEISKRTALPIKSGDAHSTRKIACRRSAADLELEWQLDAPYGTIGERVDTAPITVGRNVDHQSIAPNGTGTRRNPSVRAIAYHYVATTAPSLRPKNR